MTASQPLTWADIQRLASEHAGAGYKWTRQALERHAAIKSAYLTHETARRKLIKSGGRTGRRLTEPQKMARLEQESEVLHKRLDEYDERFATYLANAIAHGLTVEQLSRPLERPSRGSGNSDEV
jgi:hypothetical protein